MTNPEAAAAVKRLIDLFPPYGSNPQITDELAKIVHGKLLSFGAKPAERAITEHAARHKDFNLPNLLEGLRAAERSEKTQKVEFPSHAQILAKQKGCGEQEAVLRYHRQMYVEMCKRADPGLLLLPLLKETRKQHCVNHLRGELGVAYDDSLRWAASITLPVEDFKLVLEDLRQNGMALDPKDERAPGQINAADIFQRA